jgi:hypothetical protein
MAILFVTEGVAALASGVAIYRIARSSGRKGGLKTAVAALLICLAWSAYLGFAFFGDR